MKRGLFMAGVAAAAVAPLVPVPKAAVTSLVEVDASAYGPLVIGESLPLITYGDAIMNAIRCCCFEAAEGGARVTDVRLSEEAREALKARVGQYYVGADGERIASLDAWNFGYGTVAIRDLEPTDNQDNDVITVRSACFRIDQTLGVEVHVG